MKSKEYPPHINMHRGLIWWLPDSIVYVIPYQNRNTHTSSWWRCWRCM